MVSTGPTATGVVPAARMPNHAPISPTTTTSSHPPTVRVRRRHPSNLGAVPRASPQVSPTHRPFQEVSAERWLTHRHEIAKLQSEHPQRLFATLGAMTQPGHRTSLRQAIHGACTSDAGLGWSVCMTAWHVGLAAHARLGNRIRCVVAESGNQVENDPVVEQLHTAAIRLAVEGNSARRSIGVLQRVLTRIRDDDSARGPSLVLLDLHESGYAEVASLTRPGDPRHWSSGPHAPQLQRDLRSGFDHRRRRTQPGRSGVVAQRRAECRTGRRPNRDEKHVRSQGPVRVQGRRPPCLRRPGGGPARAADGRSHPPAPKVDPRFPTDRHEPPRSLRMRSASHGTISTKKEE